MASPQSVFTNPELLNISDLSSQLERMNNRPNNGLLAMQGLNSLVDQFNNKNKENQIKSAMQGAFNQETGQFDQNKILQGLVNIDPNLAMQYQEKFNKSNLESLVKQSQADNYGAQATKHLSETDKKKLESEKLMVESLSERLSSLRSDDVDGWNNILRQAESKGIPITQYGLSYNKVDIEKAQKLAIEAKNFYTAQLNGQNLLLNQEKLETQKNQFTQTHALAQDRFAHDQQKQAENLALEKQKAEAKESRGVDVTTAVDASGRLVAIPKTITPGQPIIATPVTNQEGKYIGSEKSIKQIEKLEQTEAYLNKGQAITDRLVDTANRILNIVTENPNIVGSKIDEWRTNIGLEKVRNELEALINRISSQGTLLELQALKESSPSGASGLGALSNYEAQMLAAASAGVTIKNSANEIVTNLNKLIEEADRTTAERQKIRANLTSKINEANKTSGVNIPLPNQQSTPQQGQDMEAIKRAYMMSKGVKF